jgi:hypothetical protein
MYKHRLMKFLAGRTREQLKAMDFLKDVGETLGEFAQDVDGREISQVCWRNIQKVLGGQMV